MLPVLEIEVMAVAVPPTAMVPNPSALANEKPNIPSPTIEYILPEFEIVVVALAVPPTPLPGSTANAP